jgi:hypothetical protein
MRRIHSIKMICLLFLFLGLTMAAWSEEEQGTVIINRAVGPGFTVNRGGVEEYIEVGKNNQVSYRLKQGDIVNVEARTFLEVICLPSNTTINVAELTSFSLVAIDSSGNAKIALYYGRMKASIPGKGDKGNLQIIGPQAMALTKASDFGYDFIYSSDGKLMNQIYCVQGNVEVFPRQIEEKPNKEAPKTSLQAKEMVTISGFFADGEYEKKFFEEDILQYWKENNVEERLKKLASVGSDEEVVAKAREESTEKKEAGKEKTIDEMLDRKEEEGKEGKEKPKEEAQPQGKGLHFVLDFGLDFSFLLYTTNPPSGGLFDFLKFAGMDWLVDFLNFLFKVRGGMYVDGVLMLNDNIGFGLESGLSYNYLIVDTTTFHFFSIPAFLLVRFNAGALYTQWYGGLYIQGVVEEDNFGSMSISSVFDTGVRLGLNMGGFTMYLSTGISFPDFNQLFAGRFDWRAGIGFKFNLANF